MQKSEPIKCQNSLCCEPAEYKVIKWSDGDDMHVRYLCGHHLKLWQEDGTVQYLNRLFKINVKIEPIQLKEASGHESEG